MVQSRSINKQRVRAKPAASIQSHARQSVDNQPFVRVFFFLFFGTFFSVFLPRKQKDREESTERIFDFEFCPKIQSSKLTQYTLS